MQRVSDVIWNRKFLCTKKENRLGLAPSNAEKGDVVCIFYGCSVPGFIRELENTNNFELIGECYLHGMTDGDAVSGSKKVELEGKAEDFIIR